MASNVCPGSHRPAACIVWGGDNFNMRGRGVCKHCWYSVTINPSNEAHRHPFKGIKPPTPAPEDDGDRGST